MDRAFCASMTSPATSFPSMNMEKRSMAASGGKGKMYVPSSTIRVGLWNTWSISVTAAPSVIVTFTVWLVI